MILALLLAQVTMNLASPQQTIDGFGAAGSIFGANGIPNEGGWSASTISTLYDPSKIGLNILRIGIASSDAVGVGNVTHFEDNNPGFNNMMVDCVRILKLNPAVKVFATPWSANNACKSSGNLNTGTFLTACNSSWSTWIGDAADIAKNTGCPLYAVSAQNEPDFDPGGSHEGMTFTAAAFTAWLKVLGPVLAAKSPAPLLMAGESSQWINAYTATGTGYIDNCTADPTCLSTVGIWAVHSYTPVGAATAPGTLSSKHLWMTEASDLNAVNDAMTGTGGGLAAAIWTHNGLVTGGANAWVAWWGVTHNSNNDGLIDNDGTTVTKRAYVLGQFARFVLPGMVRFPFTGSAPSNVSISMFKDPTSNNVAIVAINNQASTTSLTVILDSTSKVQVVTPWVTDPSNNIAGQSPINLSQHSFTVTLSASSVTTFVGNGT